MFVGPLFRSRNYSYNLGVDICDFMEVRNGSRVNRLNKDSFKIYLIYTLILILNLFKQGKCELLKLQKWISHLS